MECRLLWVYRSVGFHPDQKAEALKGLHLEHRQQDLCQWRDQGVHRAGPLH